MNHFTSIENLNKEQVLKICSYIKDAKENKLPCFKDKVRVCNIFNEASTRTLLSFKVAEDNLGMTSMDFMSASSSLTKGETLYDTVEVLKQYKITNFVIRDSKNEFYKELEKIEGINVINAGDGTNQHPTQAMLDIYTILEHFNFDIENKSVLFLGDIANSRVFHSNVQILKLFNVKMYCISPDEFYEKVDGIKRIEKVSDIISEIDLCCTYRIQHERHSSKFDISDFNYQYGLNLKNLENIKEGFAFTHPGPVNWGVELSDELKYSSNSLILKQVENGMYTRMAILAIVNNLVEVK